MDPNEISERSNSVVETGWGTLRWLISSQLTPGAEQTLGVVTIPAGNRNPLHRHPNCEELLYVVSGTCRHRLGDQEFDLGPGQAIRIPRGEAHCARALGPEPLVAVISFSAPERLTEDLEEGATA